MFPFVLSLALPPVGQLALPNGFLESLGDVVVMAGTLVLALMLVALGGYAYKQLRGDGVEWPDEDEDEDDGLQRGSGDDEWDYY